MSIYATDNCPVCCDPPAPFTNTAHAAGRYQCSCGCCGDICASSCPVVTEIVDVSLDKTVCPACARAGQSVRYTITVCNRSSVPITCVRITDPHLGKHLDVEAIYVNGQCVHDGCLCKGILIPGIGAGCCAAVTVEARVPEEACGVIRNVAYACFEYESACGTTQQSISSNEAVLTIVSPGLEIEKEADRCAVSAEENVITYTLTVRNTGTCTIENVVVTDVLPNGLCYVPCSTRVNGCAPTDQDPACGICVGTLDPGKCAVITFQARAEFCPCSD